MSAQYQAVHVKPAFNTADHATDDYDVRKFNATTTSQANAIPAKFCGKYVTLFATGDDVHFGFSTESGATIDSGLSETAAGAATGAGDVLANGIQNRVPVRVPTPPPGGSIYFVRETASGTAAVYMVLSSG